WCDRRVRSSGNRARRVGRFPRAVSSCGRERPCADSRRPQRRATSAIRRAGRRRDNQVARRSSTGCASVHLDQRSCSTAKITKGTKQEGERLSAVVRELRAFVVYHELRTLS